MNVGLPDRWIGIANKNQASNKLGNKNRESEYQVNPSVYQENPAIYDNSWRIRVGVLRDGFRDRIMPEIDHQLTSPLLRSVAIAAHLWRNHFSPISLQRAKRSAESTEFDAQGKNGAGL